MIWKAKTGRLNSKEQPSPAILGVTCTIDPFSTTVNGGNVWDYQPHSDEHVFFDNVLLYYKQDLGIAYC